MGDFLDNHIEDILAGMPSPKEIIQQELEEEIKRLNMFRLLSLTILHHRVLGNINLTFSQDENQEHYPEDIYTSVVIGANGIERSGDGSLIRSAFRNNVIIRDKSYFNHNHICHDRRGRNRERVSTM